MKPMFRDERAVPDAITPGALNVEAFASLDKLRERARTIPVLDWLTATARDAVVIAVCFADFDCKELVGRLARVRGRGERLNVATVYRVMGEMARDHDAYMRESWSAVAPREGSDV